MTLQEMFYDNASVNNQMFELEQFSILFFVSNKEFLERLTVFPPKFRRWEF